MSLQISNVAELNAFAQNRHHIDALAILTSPHAVRVYADHAQYKISTTVPGAIAVAQRFLDGFLSEGQEGERRDGALFELHYPNLGDIHTVNMLCRVLSNARGFFETAFKASQQVPASRTKSAFVDALQKLAAAQVVGFVDETEFQAYKETLGQFGLVTTIEARKGQIPEMPEAVMARILYAPESQKDSAAIIDCASGLGTRAMQLGLD